MSKLRSGFVNTSRNAGLFCALPCSLPTNLFVELLRRIGSSPFRGQLILANSYTAWTA